MCSYVHICVEVKGCHDVFFDHSPFMLRQSLTLESHWLTNYASLAAKASSSVEEELISPSWLQQHHLQAMYFVSIKVLLTPPLSPIGK